MHNISMKNGELAVPDHVDIPFVEGDGVGPDIMAVCRKAVDAAVATAYGDRRKINWIELLAGEKAFRLTGEWLPEATLEGFKHYLVGIKGPLTTPVGGGFRSLNVTLRQQLDLYVCQRPVRWFDGVGSPVRHPELVDMTIFRENTEDIYAGIEWEAGSAAAKKFYNFLSSEMQVSKVRFPESSAFGVKPISQEGSERLVRSALSYAVKSGKTKVTLVHKGNIMKFTEGGFKAWGYALAEREFGDYIKRGELVVDDCICDAFLQNALLYPERYEVVATMNLNGDYISDHLAAMVGGIGMAPGANINYSTGHAIFEATHGTAPQIAGQNKANPCSLLLSAVMMLEYMGWEEAANLLTERIATLIKAGKVTADLATEADKQYTVLGTSEFGELLNA